MAQASSAALTTWPTLVLLPFIHPHYELNSLCIIDWLSGLVAGNNPTPTSSLHSSTLRASTSPSLAPNDGYATMLVQVFSFFYILFGLSCSTGSVFNSPWNSNPFWSLIHLVTIKINPSSHEMNVALYTISNPILPSSLHFISATLWLGYTTRLGLSCTGKWLIKGIVIVLKPRVIYRRCGPGIEFGFDQNFTCSRLTSPHVPPRKCIYAVYCVHYHRKFLFSSLLLPIHWLIKTSY